METLPAPPPLMSTASAPPAPAPTSGHGHAELGLDDPVESRHAHPQAGASEESETTQQGMNGNDLSAPSLQSPGIKVEFHGQGPGQGQQEAVPQEPRPQLAATLPKSAPAVPQFQSPMRQHKRTPSQHRVVKETLNARSEYMNDDANGSSQHVLNQYTILEEIGRGSYGAVHRAVDQYGNAYAVKEFSKTRLRKRIQSNILRRGPRRPGRLPVRHGVGPGMDPGVSHQLSEQRSQEDKDALFLIRQEIAIMKKLNHPNLVSLIEVLDDPEEDSLYMVLEMCNKGVIMNVGLEEDATPYSEEECRCWFRDLILGIEYLHAQGVVHRDIKPDNLLLTDDDVLKIVDFGVSEMFEKPEQMRTAKSAGSPAFLPPELCVAKHGDVSGTAADIWSMGVTLYCLRYGYIPFKQAGVLEIYQAIKEDTPVIPEDENPHLKDLLMRLMEKDPTQRITMAEIREHPWVTKEGVDPLLDAEENCSDPVEPPNELEVSHAFTRRMTHLLCVMRAISNFKALLSSRSRLNSPRLNLSPSDAASPTTPHMRPRHKPKPSMDEQELSEFKRQNEQHAMRLLKERMHVLKSRATDSLPMPFSSKEREQTDPEGPYSPATHREHGEHPPRQAPLVLGIGSGGIGDGPPLGNNSEPPSVVADSPGAVDFNVYDRAYEEEIQRIKMSGGRPSVYMTWHLGEKEKFRGQEGKDLDLLEDRHGEEHTLQEADHSGKDKLKDMFKAHRFADLVSQTIKDTKEKVVGEESAS
ncbi:hypothetical protein N0V93_005455 [Gnomoniopsis smithogilvyi]|uniref:Protein kinase domain-containing protein n=1 Tax=Gnomoniopsis smithogilvyi TaxID=1191159 RepID=A0A9W9CY22_9PEZI|nr:hypothetical protein N0V93_005455 [Gnomoniopsis smithogilvyi]